MAWCHRHTFVVAMTKEGCTSLCMPSIIVSGWRVSLLGLGTIELHSFDSPFLIGAEEVLLNHQAPGLGILSERLF